jgi:hypothetical protein
MMIILKNSKGELIAVTGRKSTDRIAFKPRQNQDFKVS